MAGVWSCKKKEDKWLGSGGKYETNLQFTTLVPTHHPAPNADTRKAEKWAWGINKSYVGSSSSCNAIKLQVELDYVNSGAITAPPPSFIQNNLLKLTFDLWTINLKFLIKIPCLILSQTIHNFEAVEVVRTTFTTTICQSFLCVFLMFCNPDDVYSQSKQLFIII